MNVKTNNKLVVTPQLSGSGFGGLLNTMLTSVTHVRGFKPGQSLRIFRSKNPHHAFLRMGRKSVCPMSLFEASKRPYNYR
jgi:hypothetical protein